MGGKKNRCATKSEPMESLGAKCKRRTKEIF